jgi:hypothetical protein
VAVTALLAFPGIASAKDLDCGDFKFQEDAQAEFEKDRSDPHRLDALRPGEGDGVACESLPRRGSGGQQSNGNSDDNDSASDATPVDKSSKKDRDCADFASQKEAQDALDADSADSERLDKDDDDIACEDHFGSDKQQVQVRPKGAVDTGGWPVNG